MGIRGLTQRSPDPFPVRSDTHNRHAKDLLLLRTETENARNFVLPWRHLTRVLQMAVHRILCGDIRILELIWVCLLILEVIRSLRDAFPAQRFLPGDLDLPTTTSVHRDVLGAALCPRRA